MREVDVPASRVERWVANFADRHGGVELSAEGGELRGSAPDGSRFTARPPLGGEYAGPSAADAFAAAVRPLDDWGVLLVRKGGFAVARMAGDGMAAHKVGRRHVQGRTKAGGQSQQRFARRRGNQAREAYRAAADHAAEILGAGRLLVVTGGDRAAVEEVLADARLARVAVVPPWMAVPDPRRAVLDDVVARAVSARFTVHDTQID